MKLEKKFESRQNELFFIDGPVLPLSDTAINARDVTPDFSLPQDKNLCYRLDVAWSVIGTDEDCYDENFLAGLRDWLKLCEENQIYVYIHSVADADVSSQEKKLALTASFKHCARRIKDCASVVGFSVPPQADAEYFVQELSAKHPNYVFFGTGDLLQNSAVVCEK